MRHTATKLDSSLRNSTVSSPAAGKTICIFYSTTLTQMTVPHLSLLFLKTKQVYCIFLMAPIQVDFGGRDLVQAVLDFVALLLCLGFSPQSTDRLWLSPSQPPGDSWIKAMNHSFHTPAWFNVFFMVFEGVITLFYHSVFPLIVSIVKCQ